MHTSLRDNTAASLKARAKTRDYSCSAAVWGHSWQGRCNCVPSPCPRAAALGEDEEAEGMKLACPAHSLWQRFIVQLGSFCSRLSTR